MRIVPTSSKFQLIILFLILHSAFWFTNPLSGQDLPEGQRKQMQALRLNGPAPKIDGKLDEAVWQQAYYISDFLQKEPNQGTVPQDSTKVAIIYDEEAVYVGARMYCAHPESVRTYLSRRDNPGQAEMIILSFDTYLDRRSSYDFGVTSSGVRFDRYHPVDFEYETDYSYNAVWDAHSHIDSLGWTAEFRIPFSQLRFNNQEKQVWGVNFNRWIPARREDDFWIYTPRDQTGWASRFGDLLGLEGIKASRRLELLPYLASDGNFKGEVEPGDPFQDGSEFSGRLGGDLKMGLGPNLTLDATFNPDFGQVEADPAVVNLTAYETFFQEKRPFFIEGSQLFQASGPTYFYSRRIGAPPHGDASGDFVDAPGNTTILGAAKITGRLKSGLSGGTLAALTGDESARTYQKSSGIYGQTKIEPVTGYGVVRLQKEFGPNSSTAGIILTGVNRFFANDDSALTDRLRKRAYSGGADWNLRFKGGAYELNGNAGFSFIQGDKEAVLKTQTSSAHYFQRPDAGHVELDSNRTSLLGYTGALGINKNSGKHWLWGAGFWAESPGFELNDCGILSSADDFNTWGNLRYRETNPGKLFREYTLALYLNDGYNFGGVRQFTYGSLQFNGTWKNYWFTYLAFGLQGRALSDDLSRGGPLVGTPSGWWAGTEASNNFSASTRYGWEFYTSGTEFGAWDYNIGFEFSTRLGKRLEFSANPYYFRGVYNRQYITTIDSGSPATFDKRYIFSFIDQSTLSTQFRLSYFFTPDLSLELYAEPFSASGHYYGFGELKEAGGRELRRYGEDGTTIAKNPDGSYTVTDSSGSFSFRNVNGDDFGALSFRSNLVLRWEFRPGSTLYLVWQQDRSGDKDPGRLVRPGNLWKAIEASGDNFLAIKISYWLSVS